MLRLPRAIEIEVRASERSDDHGAANILVSLHLVLGGSYYCGIPALTDEAGLVSFHRDSIIAAFERDRALFPMDFKAPLSGCDSEVDVVIRGGSDFEELRQAVENNSMVLPHFRTMWTGAKNASLPSVSCHVHLGNPRPDEIKR